MRSEPYVAPARQKGREASSLRRYVGARGVWRCFQWGFQAGMRHEATALPTVAGAADPVLGRQGAVLCCSERPLCPIRRADGACRTEVVGAALNCFADAMITQRS